MKQYSCFLVGLLLMFSCANVYGQQNASIADGCVIGSVNINGQTTPPSSNVTAGQSFSVSFQYQIWDRINSNAIWYISVGIDTLPQVVAYSGIPGFYPGASGTANVNVTAPNTSGTYQIRVCASPSVSQSVAFQNYRDVYRTITYQPGAIGKITVGGSNTSLHPVIFSWGYSISGTSSISFTTSYQVWDNSNPSAIWYVVAALDSMPQQVVYSGIPGTAPGVTNTATVTLTNYGSQKVRQVYLWAIPAINQATAFSNYRFGWANGRSQAGSTKSPIVITSVELQNNLLPSTLSLSQNYPNPFNPTTAFDYAVAQRGEVLVQILNALGQHIATLFQGMAEPGNYKVSWDGRSASGLSVASGTYFYQLTFNKQVLTKRMLFIK